MPTYQYRCASCEEFFEVVQSFTDDALTTCESCGGALRKIFSGVGVVFKGSGFYRTDSRGSSSSPANGGTSESAGSSTPAATGSTSSTSGEGSASTSATSGTSSSPTTSTN